MISNYIQKNWFGLPEKISYSVRKRMYLNFLSVAHPSKHTRILDVGVTADRRKDSNFFEKMYPYPKNITAVGTENADYLTKEYGCTFMLADGTKLPFKKSSFDIVVSWATLEHVGSRNRQRQFISELCRVAPNCYVTTPNRFFPFEFHTLLPLVHWLPSKYFRLILKSLGYAFFSQEQNLNLLSKTDAEKLFPKKIKVKTIPFYLGGCISNYAFFAHR